MSGGGVVAWRIAWPLGEGFEQLEVTADCSRVMGIRKLSNAPRIDALVLQSDLAAAIARAEALRAAGRRVTDAFRAHGKAKGLVADARTERECIAAMVALDEAIAAQQAEGEA